MYHSRILGGAGPVVRQWQRREQISDATLQRHGAWQHFNVLRFELGFVRLQCKAIHYKKNHDSRRKDRQALFAISALRIKIIFCFSETL